MEERNNGYSGMYLSAAYFLLIVSVEYYPLIEHVFGPMEILQSVYNFLRTSNIPATGIMSRCILVGLLMGGIMIYKPKRDDKISKTPTLIGFLLSIGLLFLSGWHINVTQLTQKLGFVIFALGYIGAMTYGMRLFQLLNFDNLSKNDPFNERNETFLQNEDYIDTPHSANIPYSYIHKNKKRKGWINYVNLFRALLVIGTPGSGKSFSVIEEIMGQLIRKGFAMVIYDFKFNSLTKKAYGYLMDSKIKGTSSQGDYPEMFFICFDDLRMTHRCNPMHQNLITNQSDAIDIAETLLKNLNPEWIQKQDYFSRSAISFTGACIWYLKKKADELELDICTPGHLSILSTVKVDLLMQIMMQDKEVRQILIPFKDALEKKAMEQLSGQTSTVQISLSKLATKEIFYVMSGNDFTLEINDPDQPKILSLQNNPERKQVYSAALGMYMNGLMKKVNKPQKRPMALILDELPTLFIMLLRTIIDTGRENKIATILGIQSFTQLVLDYGKDMAEVIYDNCANVICGAAKGETARRLNELFGKIHQEQISKNTSSNDVGTNISTQMMDLLPRSKIATMSTGYFAGIVADTFEHQIKEKKCFGQLEPDIRAKSSAMGYELPIINEFVPKDFQMKHDMLLKELKAVYKVPFFKSLFEETKRQVVLGSSFFFEYIDKYENNATKAVQMKGLAKRYNLVKHKYDLVNVMSSGSPDKAIREFFSDIIREYLIACEIESVSSQNFENIMREVDTLVKNEYSSLTGEVLKNAIFDEEKINSEMASAMSNSDEAAKSFMENFQKNLSEEDLETLITLQEEYDTEMEEPFSSYPIESYE
jgi:hypothetical protein